MLSREDRFNIKKREIEIELGRLLPPSVGETLNVEIFLGNSGLTEVRLTDKIQKHRTVGSRAVEISPE